MVAHVQNFRRIFRLILLFALILPQSSSSVPVRAAQPAQVREAVPLAPEQPQATQYAAIAAGRFHTCALTTGGGMKCWGYNFYGQLGDGTTTDHTIPMDVAGLANNVTAIAVGDTHTCAVMSGGVKCWGSNFYGQLGDGTTTERSMPEDVVGLSSGVVALGVGGGHTCALVTGGGVKCWGWNEHGELGDGTTVNRNTPVDVVGLTSDVMAITAGGRWGHTCALITGGGVRCWGRNGSGQLGDGTTTDRSTPVNVVGLAGGVTAITAGGSHTCALVTGGGAKCWGFNSVGQLGDGTNTWRWTPVDVVGLASGVLTISGGDEHTCVLLAGGGAKCWGGNWLRRLGDGTDAEYRNQPVNVVGLSSGVTSITAGGSHTCAVVVGGKARCWGGNNYGQLGVGLFLRSIPTEVPGLASGVTAIASGGTAAAGLVGMWTGYTCAVVAEGGVKCWGDGYYDQPGNGTMPVDVVGLASGVTAITAGESHACALAAGGGVKCWGDNFYGQLGDGTGTDSLIPVDVVGLASGVTAITAGDSHTCALFSGGGVKCWGGGNLVPVDIVELASGVAAIAAGQEHTCVLLDSGGVKCWGSNFSGQLGDGTTHHSSVPVDVVGLESGVTAITAKAHHTCALLVGGGVKCWGQSHGSYVPVDVVGLESGVIAIAAGGYADWVYPDGNPSYLYYREFTCALMSGGAVKCWGLNESGQLGDGTTQNRTVPVDVAGLAGNVTALAAGGEQAYAIAAGRAKYWGAEMDPMRLTLYPSYPIPTDVADMPSMSLSYINGSPGSTLTVTGWGFPISSTVGILANGYALTGTVSVNATGSFIFFLDTTGADEGLYHVTASVGAGTLASFVLRPGAPLCPQEGGGQILSLPAGIGIPIKLSYLPVTIR